ncbi:hypothetical protein [Streptomyces antnestii]|uniref:hypothetical protein n=1 Tax=Streptomyces antnestii TaxID=2494256 RepID=UPI001CB93AA8|nr:hypothetical protein [Streptomyces sp. San01]
MLLAEYDRIKEEQKTRIGFRDNLLYFTLAASTAVLAITVQSRQAQLLLAVPVVCLVLGWTYLVNDEKISAVGCYIRDRSCAMRSGSSSASLRELMTRMGHSTPRAALIYRHMVSGRDREIAERLGSARRSARRVATRTLSGPCGTRVARPRS